MSAMGQLHGEICDLLNQGVHPTRIARQLDVPLFWIYDVLESMPETDS